MKIIEPIWKQNNELVEILQIVNGRLVGGCVRDYILFNKLVEDIDIATPLLPEKIIELLKKKYNVIPTGLKHGTVTVIGKTSHKYEITTLRKDEITNGRHAQVSFHSNWQEDAARRDFTINGLYSDSEGNIYDYFQGMHDLKNSCVKFIGIPKERICEDYLRIMRFFRFVARFGNYDLASLEACNELAPNLSKISRERITYEWFKIIEGKYFFEIFEKFKPILEAIGLKNLVLKEWYKKLSPLGLTYLFYCENSQLLLSNEQKRYLNRLNLKLETESDALFLMDKFGSDIAKDKMQIEQKFFELIILPKFPIYGSDLLKLGYNGEKLGQKLNELYMIWLKNKGQISKMELLNE